MVFGKRVQTYAPLGNICTSSALQLSNAQTLVNSSKTETDTEEIVNLCYLAMLAKKVDKQTFWAEAHLHALSIRSYLSLFLPRLSRPASVDAQILCECVRSSPSASSIMFRISK